MAERKMWKKEEDEMIRVLFLQNETKDNRQKLTWAEIAGRLQAEIKDCKRTGKQCRQRWFNHLNPQIIKDKQLSPEEVTILFDLQNRMGNRWAQIAKRMPGRTDNNVKNYFYSSLRRAIRQINYYVAQYKKKSNIKPFKQAIINKILGIQDEKVRNKLDIRNKAANELAQSIKDMLAKLSLDEEYKQLSAEDIEFREKLVRSIQEFNKGCKKKKEKKIGRNKSNNYEESALHLEPIEAKNHKKAKKKPQGSQQQGEKRQKTQIKISYAPRSQSELKDQQIQPLFKTPSCDDQFEPLNKRKQEIDFPQQQQDKPHELIKRHSSSKIQSSISGVQVGSKSSSSRYESSEFFSQLMLGSRGSEQEEKTSGYIANLSNWKKESSKHENHLFPVIVPHNALGLDPLFLRSMEFGPDAHSNLREYSNSESAFLKLSKNSSRNSSAKHD